MPNVRENAKSFLWRGIKRRAIRTNGATNSTWTTKQKGTWFRAIQEHKANKEVRTYHSYTSCSLPCMYYVYKYENKNTATANKLALRCWIHLRTFFWRIVNTDVDYDDDEKHGVTIIKNINLSYCFLSEKRKWKDSRSWSPLYSLQHRARWLLALLLEEYPQLNMPSIMWYLNKLRVLLKRCEDSFLSFFSLPSLSNACFMY